MPFVSVVTPCYNEEENVRELYARVARIFAELEGYTYEHVFIDNASRDRTPAILRELAREDPAVKVIFNTRNFGQLRSPFHAMLQARGEAVILIVCDLQDPPELVREFLALWREGYPVVMGVKTASRESRLMFALRTLYYRMLRRLSDVELVEHFTGSGLFDRRVIEVLRSLDDPNPYTRGLIAEMGFESARVEYEQPQRKRGISKNNLLTLFDIAMLGMTCYTKVPLRLATFMGFCTAGLSLLAGTFYFLYKLIFWQQFSLGMAPIVVGLFFFSSVQLIFLGIVGEYIGSIHAYVQHRPHVIERERLNFDVSAVGRGAPDERLARGPRVVVLAPEATPAGESGEPGVPAGTAGGR